MAKPLRCLLLLFSTFQLFSQTPVPDVNFEQFLVDEGIDSNGLTGDILNADAAAVTNLNITVNTITDFTGLEAFVNLITLNAGRNQFATLPLNTLTALEELVFDDNDALASLDLSNNTALRILELDSYIPGLVPHPPITVLDLSNNINLEDLTIGYMVNIDDLILPETASLTDIDINQVREDDLNFSKLSGLENLRIRGSAAVNPVTITLPDEKTVLKSLSISAINLDTVDVSEFIALENLYLFVTNVQTLLLPATNTLTDIDINNHRITNISFVNQPGLINLELNSIENGLGPLVVDLSQNLALEDLDLSNNEMTSIDIVNNVNLTDLDLGSNELTTLDITSNVLLEDVNVNRNQLTTLDLSQNPLLERLNISYNQFPGLDVTNNPELGSLIISNNLFTGTGLDLTQNPQLYYIDCSFNQIQSLNITQNTNLASFIGNNNLFSGTDIMDQFYNIQAARGGIYASQLLYVHFNNLSGRIPDFAGLINPNTNYFRLRFNDNNFEFGDFEDDHAEYVFNMSATNTFSSTELPIMTEYHYAPQAKVNNIENFTRNAGEDITLTTIVRGSQNHYQWFKDGMPLAGAPDSPELVLIELDDCDAGVYYCEITSDLVPFENANPPGTDGKNLLLVRNDISLNINVNKTCASLINPLNAATDVPVTTGLTWRENPSACSYILTVGTATGASDVVPATNVGKVETFNFDTDLAFNTTYFVNITPVFSDGSLGGCTEESFTTGSDYVVPDCTSLVSPENGALDVAIDTDVSWNHANGADAYRITIGTTTGNNDILDNFDVGNVTTYDLPTDLPENTEIYVTVTPYNVAGGAMDCTEESFTTTNVATVPSCTTLSNPANGSADVPWDTDVTWNAITEATGYRLTVGTSSGANDILNNFDVGNVTTYDLPSDLPHGTTIYVLTTPYNTVGDAVGCSEESFTTDLASTVACVRLINPLNGATNVSVTTDLTWETEPIADGYRLTVATSSGGNDILNNVDVGNATTYDLATDLPANTQIFVTIVPYDSVGSALDCSEESFTTSTPTIPSCTTLVSPIDGAVDISITTDLTWNSVNNADGYRLSIRDGASVSYNILDDVDVGNVTVFDLPNDLPENSDIYVLIVPYNDTGDAIGCTEAFFVTGEEPTIPECTSLLSPNNGSADIPIDINLSWNIVSNANGYRLIVGAASGQNDILDSADVGNVTFFDLPNDLPMNTEIFVTIVPYNSVGDATGCVEESFTTFNDMGNSVPNCTRLNTPADGAMDVAVDTDISWDSIAAADGYRLTIGTDSGGNDILNGEDVGLLTSYDLAENLPNAQQIYVTITPYNAQGNALGCNEESFTTIGLREEGQAETLFGFSPDGDGINDYWEINGIENHPANTVIIFNRWGDMVFKIEGYDNAGNVFRGEANQLTGMGAGQLPEGTYFFQINIPEEHNLKTTQGYLVLKR
ncbi:gliding motility-associated C-terminal domain-containing protein [Flagellimonas lutaonensis]|uniref:Ig-like domain-containing protein n=1 Tax=Flagellimonas lutaonensis TaxID=516051 RepID=A0A0D5YS10_9FLAO|nr:gliding motility-associated C-terminal domain-containing protein [Allomuricauda lutaonensis]AKA34668.1 hypothetical protein VC82_1021 [Allomuricauda lutaonensis]